MHRALSLENSANRFRAFPLLSKNLTASLSVLPFPLLLLGLRSYRSVELSSDQYVTDAVRIAILVSSACEIILARSALS